MNQALFNILVVICLAGQLYLLRSLFADRGGK